ncbi:hypothetical protein FJT64_019955 [Amphibalanus amphitrite]|uniref:G-protein coupled receptors family 1 profile domain-containing protein n=1 Tax=Amphibalanus amphitrite TaxID=1232801 RepID=A0A6A4X1X8_AMPAM|nr:hypothetical protein FJT64_019955 [Amphibalanus amphitrite]
MLATNTTEPAAAAAAAAAECGADVWQLSRHLLYVLLAAAGLVPQLSVAQDLTRHRRSARSASDDTLLTRMRISIVLMTLSNLWKPVSEHVHEWPSLVRPACLAASMVEINTVGLISAANCLVSACRLQQVSAARLPALAPHLTQTRLRWQNRLLLAATGVGLALAPLFGLNGFGFYLCTGEPLPERPPALALFAINSSINTSNFLCCVLLLRASSGRQGTHRPRNYVPSESWAQLGLCTVLVDTLLVPINTSQLPAGNKALLNHLHITLLHGVLGPGLLRLMAGRWRHQVREQRRKVATAAERPPTSTQADIRLDLI